MNDFPEEREAFQQFIRRWQAGEEEAFFQVLRRMMPLIRSHARRYAQLSGGDPEDLMQEGAIGLFRAMKQYRLESDVPFASFAAICVDNSIRSAIRAENRKKRRAPGGTVSLMELPDQIPDRSTQANPEETVENQTELAELFELFFSKLSMKEKQVLEAFIDGCAYQEIAQRLQISRKSVDNTLQRVRKKFRKLFEEYGKKI